MGSIIWRRNFKCPLLCRLISLSPEEQREPGSLMDFRLRKRHAKFPSNACGPRNSGGSGFPQEPPA